MRENPERCIQQSLRGLVPRAATRLLDEPFAEAGFNILLGKSAIRARVFYATAHFVQHIEMILYVLDRAVLGETLE